VPPISILGITYPPGANAVQFTSGSWHAIVDTGSQTPADLRFVLRGEVEPAARIGGEGFAPVRTAVAFRPNPFRSGISIELALARPGTARLRIHDVTGRLVREIAAGRVAAGVHALRWDGRDGDGAPLAASPAQAASRSLETALAGAGRL
jgi:hypothetical protein